MDNFANFPSNVMVWLQECAAKEESYLLEKMAELLASSNARKNSLVYITQFSMVLNVYVVNLISCFFVKKKLRNARLVIVHYSFTIS